MMMRRRGRPLVRAAATTAVVAGTAGAVRHRQDVKYANQAANQQADMQAQQEAAYEAGEAAAQQQAAAAPAAPAENDITAQLQQLAALHTAGVLSDEEFAAGKAKLLGIG
jgi:nucleoside phosphorylase